jgi:hypothetical protein
MRNEVVADRRKSSRYFVRKCDRVGALKAGVVGAAAGKNQRGKHYDEPTHREHCLTG